MTAPGDATPNRSAGDAPSPEDVATAYHEAGHAVVALALGRPVEKVSIKPDDRRLGWCAFRKGLYGARKDVIEAHVLILLGGIAAEARKTGRYGWDEAAQDFRDLRSLTRPPNERHAERFERRMLDKTEHLLDRPGLWPAVEAIAAELLSRTAISGRAARHLFAEAIARAERDA